MMKSSDILYIYFMLGKRGVTFSTGHLAQVNSLDEKWGNEVLCLV